MCWLVSRPLPPRLVSSAPPWRLDAAPSLLAVATPTLPHPGRRWLRSRASQEPPRHTVVFGWCIMPPCGDGVSKARGLT
ncbi:uncharacterized protein B0H18DRAFT_277832 [Fomitopsis serialis]|uniref:uncharacterized protein n=1 Tax=Fomitopsis serialis TaxID=139415 RepID=UPI002008BCEE|nr:uncharacterized protein B0H18DRAFT_277832 [Neoantrodia serialis]KAH9912079.1 hypothetical protein B0H18DRAFT_277832 [Neoantrodia serialis]